MAKPGRGVQNQCGLSLTEVLILILITAVTLVSFTAVVSHDLSSTLQNRANLIAKTAAEEQLEAKAKLGGFDQVLAVVNGSPFDRLDPSHPFFQLPCASSAQFVQPLNAQANGVVSLANYTVVVQVPERCDASGNPAGRVRIWRIATIAGRDGFDKTP